MRIYVASKADYAGEWRAVRGRCREADDDRYAGFEIVSSWIDATPEAAERPGFWERCENEIRACDALLAMYVTGDVWKGAFVEIGMALAFGKPVILSGEPPGTWKTHPLVHSVPSLGLPAAFAEARRAVRYHR